MITYLLTKKGVAGELTLSYNAEGRLCAFTCDMEMSDSLLSTTIHRLPILQEDALAVKKAVGWSVSEVPQDLSYEAFWKAYDYKVGDQVRCRKLWKALSDADKSKVLLVIPKYHRWLKLHTSTEQLFPTTFLNQRRFENDFTK